MIPGDKGTKGTEGTEMGQDRAIRTDGSQGLERGSENRHEDEECRYLYQSAPFSNRSPR